VCVICPEITNHTHTHPHRIYTHSNCVQSHVRPQGCQAQEHACRQLLQLVAAKVQIAVEKETAEKIIARVSKIA
jgi:hypothetical protein